MKFSNKDLLLLFGIMIAVIISLTTLVFSERAEGSQNTSKNLLKPSTSFVAPDLLKKAIDKIEFNSLVR